MPIDRRLEYENDPGAEDDPDVATDSSDTDPSDETMIGDGGIFPLKPGLLAGAGAFALIYAVAYQLTVASDAGIIRPEDGASTWVLAGFVSLVSHGGTFDEEFEPFRLGLDFLFLFGPVLLVPIALLVLGAAGYLLVQYLEPRSLKETAICAASVVPSYVTLAFVLASFATYTPDEVDDVGSGQNQVETLAIETDVSFFLSVAAVAFTFTLIGALFANRSLFLGLEAASDTPVDAADGTDGVDGTDDADDTDDVDDTDNGANDEANSEERGRSSESATDGPANSPEPTARQSARSASDPADSDHHSFPNDERSDRSDHARYR